MGFSLKEALRTLCSRNRWSYAVFWKIGCNNSKLLIWEDYYYEPLPSPFPPRTVGRSNFPYQDEEGCWFSSESQLGIQEEDRVRVLINKMMVNNSVSIAGEGIVGRAAFTGNYQWILLNNFTRDAYPPEVYPELHYQFSAGMQTVAVIPVLPHGVVQLGSFSPIMEDIGFVNDVKNFILQLGCVPGALLSEDYSAKVSNEKFAGPVTVDPPVITSNCTPSVANGSNQLTNSPLASRPVAQPPHPLRGGINNYQGSLLTPQAYNPNQVFDGICQPKAHSMIKTNVCGQPKKTIVEAEAKVIPTNFDSCLQQHSVYNARSAFNELSSFNQSNLSDGSLKYMEQQTSGVGRQSQVIPNVNPSSALNMPRLKIDGGKILEQNQSSSGSSLLGGIPICSGSNLLRTNMINCSLSNPPKVSTNTSDFSGMYKVGFGLQSNNTTTNAVLCSVPNFTNQSVTNHMNLEGSGQKSLSIDLKQVWDAFASTDQRIDDDLLQAALKIPSLHLEEHVPMGDHISGFVQDCLSKDLTSQHMMKMNVKHAEADAQLPSGDDLFDVLGVDLKRRLLNGNRNELLATDSDAITEHLDKKATHMNLQGVGPNNSYSVNEAISESGIFSGTDTDHLLDAVVLKAQSAAKQNSDEMSCRTTLTRISTASIPSPVCKQVMPDHVAPRGLFDFPKTGVKTASAETSSLRSGCSKDDAGNCSQTTSIYGSKLSSWVENSSNFKRESSVSTGYSKRPDEVCKSNRKRLKPGENPRPRPKDRQMIQDRVKELREIVPNGAKCSIDALLEKTIKHMLFLQSVTKHADKLKQTGESKIVSKEGGLLLKDNFEGGATWAYEVGAQSMVCPIIVEDLNPPRQMLVEMLCEECGFFLEIADLIRGLGLTILKGVMEARNDKIWARFAVEANRDVTRMEIFMSLVRLLDQTVKGGASSSNAIDNNMMLYHSFPQATQIPATGRPSSLQ
ncbi:transcription factor LHW-like [Glycine soja]|uniref:Transcription factor LHW isoform A n=2 Tax=Glycine soja TaxID=3848 RepID=A0A445HMU1_GLYSO|nr:transcription factor LHW-like [Glycine soja]RZB75097.1 Transcription factor LHW isoform A [Glycine soja]